MEVRMFYLLFIACFFAKYTSAEMPAFPPEKPLPTVDKQFVTDYRLALDAIFGVGIRLQALLQEEPNENFLVSPLSAASLVGQLLLGAEGEFQEQLVQLLSLPDSHLYKNDRMNVHGKEKNETYALPYSTLHLQLAGLLKTLESSPSDKKFFTLKEASALFYDKNLQLKGRFKENLRNFYRANVRAMDFISKPMRSQKVINTWASKNTNGLIKTILPQPPPPDTASIFANAIYFLAEWEMPFSDELNRKGPFNVTANKQVNVTYMVGFIEQIFYSESDDYTMIALPYKNEELSMYMLLPKPDGPYKYDMKSFALNLKATEILDTISRGNRRDVTVKLPKFTISTSFSLLKQLKKYRVFKEQKVDVNVTSRSNAIDKLEDKVDVFNNFTAPVPHDDLHLTNAAANGDLRIGDIVQQVVLTVNEKGTEAAAITAGTVNYMGGNKNFLVDRPFLFFIRHEATSATLFWGTISNPTASS